MGNIGWVQLLIVLVIVVLLFGTKRLRNLGGDLGQALRSFRQAFSDGDEQSKSEADDPERLADNAREEPANSGETAREKDQDRS